MNNLSTIVPKLSKAEIQKPRYTRNSRGKQSESRFLFKFILDEEMSIETQCPQTTYEEQIRGTAERRSTSEHYKLFTNQNFQQPLFSWQVQVR